MHDKTLKVISKTYGDFKNIIRDFSSNIINQSRYYDWQAFLNGSPLYAFLNFGFNFCDQGYETSGLWDERILIKTVYHVWAVNYSPS